MHGFKKAIFALVLAALQTSPVHAETHIPNTRVSYSVIKDPMTDANLSIIFMDELNDTGSFTYLSVKCAAGEGWVFALTVKPPLMPAGETDKDVLDAVLDANYMVSYRVGSGQPATVRDLTPVYFNGRLRASALSLSDRNANNAMAQGLVDGQKVTFRIQPISDAAMVKLRSCTLHSGVNTRAGRGIPRFY